MLTGGQATAWNHPVWVTLYTAPVSHQRGWSGTSNPSVFGPISCVLWHKRYPLKKKLSFPSHQVPWTCQTFCLGSNHQGSLLLSISVWWCPIIRRPQKFIIQISTILREKRSTINSYSYIAGTYQHCPRQSRIFVTLLISCQVEFKLLPVETRINLRELLGDWVYFYSGGEA